MDARVTTPSGRLAGVAAGPTLAFLGVPFAAPPTGRGRFRAPRPVAPWQGERDAVRVGPPAPQAPAYDLPTPSEDCLFLNVWTPALTGQRPVLVYLHGGGFHSGSGGQDMYAGRALSERGDVVVVTINYRLGALGFLHLREVLSDSAEVEDNLALRDQLQALDWVRTHIACFGGDPERVTLMGQSAGAMCAGALLSSSVLRGRAQGAILQSGALAHCILRDDAAALAERFVHDLGGSRSNPDPLWTSEADGLLAAQRALRMEIRRGRPSRPVIERAAPYCPVADGRLVPRDPVAAVQAGQGTRIPLLVGSNRDEWNFYLHLADRKKLTLDEAGLRKVIGRRIPGDGQAVVEHYLAHHLGRDAVDHSAVFSRIEGDRNFRFPAVQLATAHAPQQDRTFVYDFTHPTGLGEGRMGAFHGAELPFVFGQTRTDFGRAMCGDAPTVQPLSLAMMDAWCSFARDGVPAVEGGFPAYEAQRRAVLQLGERIEVVEAPDEATRAFWDTRL